MNKHLSMGLSAFALAALLSGCAGGGGTTATSPAGTPAPEPAPTLTATSPAATATDTPLGSAPASAGDLMVAESKAGPIVVDGKGMSVYYFTKDTKDSGTSACTGACLTTWPPVTTDADAPAAEGISATVGTIATPDGKKQVTINGMPVYYYANDKAPGDITGQGVGGVWYLVAPSGEMITTEAGS